jgi:putative oxidoreductase
MKLIPTIIYWTARLAAALLMLQTLYFKFTASEESVYIFETVGLEPLGRVSVGIMELIAAVLLLINSTAWLGALLGAGLMLGAIAMHFLFLGISVQGDGGQLFIYAVIVLVSCVYVLAVNRQKVSEKITSLAR